MINPLDLEYIFVNVLAGSPELFVFLAFITIAALASMFKMPDKIFLIMYPIFCVFMSDYVNGFYLLALLISGIIIFYTIAKIVK